GSKDRAGTHGDSAHHAQRAHHSIAVEFELRGHHVMGDHSSCGITAHRSSGKTRHVYKDSLFHRDTVMGTKHPPVVPHLHPDIGQPVVILVRLAVGPSHLVIRPGHHGDVAAAAYPHPKVRQFRDFHVN